MRITAPKRAGCWPSSKARTRHRRLWRRALWQSWKLSYGNRGERIWLHQAGLSKRRHRDRKCHGIHNALTLKLDPHFINGFARKENVELHIGSAVGDERM